MPTDDGKLEGAKAAAFELGVKMAELSEEERCEVIGVLLDLYCQWCGREQRDGQHCRCTNDD